ncbi:hypothetical protein, partial [Salmonella sp. s55004]|uniref:hypothetical protein n=1 Tax=Salmonella sp. s55004 TaxID=3159675 RepID=UPI00397FE0CE
MTQSDSVRDLACGLLATAKKENIFTEINFLDGFSLLLERLPDLEVETPLIKTQIASLGARSIIDGVAHLAEVAELMENGVCYPLFLLCLQKIAREK